MLKKTLVEAFRNRRVLITGHTGFKGSWLSLWLNLLGAKVTGYALDPRTDRDNFTATGLGKKINDLRGDIRDFAALKGVFSMCQPEIVFHLAAQALVRTGYEFPKDTLDINIGGTVNLLECCRLVPSVRALVVITSDKCYQDRGIPLEYCENDPLGGRDPYSASKGCAELVTAAYRKSFFERRSPGQSRLSAASARAGNVLGGGDWSPHRLLPDCVRSLQGGKKIVVRNPRAIRPWQFVLEPLAGYLQLAAMLLHKPRRYAGAWNFGPGMNECLPVQQIVELVIRYWGSGSWMHRSNDNLAEAQTLLLDSRKSRQKLGWRPRYTVDEAIRRSIAWYQTFFAGKNLRQLCQKQINDYMKK